MRFYSKNKVFEGSKGSLEFRIHILWKTLKRATKSSERRPSQKQEGLRLEKKTRSKALIGNKIPRRSARLAAQGNKRKED
jgi:hypothetical protein